MKWRVYAVRRYTPNLYSMKVQHFDSIIDIVEPIAEMDSRCVEAIASMLGIELRKRIRIPAIYLLRISLDNLDDECRKAVENILRRIRDANTVLEIVEV